MSPIQGFIRLRKHQFGRQQDFGDAVAATRAYPFGGVPSVELNWTDPTVDVGSFDPVAPPYRAAPDLTAPLTSESLAYNDLPAIFAGFFGNNEAPTGGGDAKFWSWHPASLTADPQDVFTYEFGDDVLDDWYQLRDGILESFELTGPEGLGPLTASMTWLFGAVASTGSTDSPVDGTVPTPGLDVDTSAALVYLKDGAILIGDNEYDLTQITEALHTFTMRFSREVDQKRFADGTQTFDLAAYGPGARTIELECTFAKTDQTVGVGSESDDWISDEAVNRFVKLEFLSTVEADTGVFYALQMLMPMRYYTRTEGESGQNSTIVLTGHAYYDSDFEGVFVADVVNTLTEAELGIAGS